MAPREVDIAHPQVWRTRDRCPGAGKGNVYRQQEPKVLVRVVGQAPLAATVYSLERLRCGACGQVFIGPRAGRWVRKSTDETAAAMIAQLRKLQSGTPFYRLEQLEGPPGDFSYRRRCSGRSCRKRRS